MGNYISNINERDRMFLGIHTRRKSSLSIKTTFLGSHNKIAATPPLSSTPLLDDGLSPTPVITSDSETKVKRLHVFSENYDINAPTVPTTPTLMQKQKEEKVAVPSDMETLRIALHTAHHKKRLRKCNSTSTMFLQYTLYKGSIPNSIRQISIRIVDILRANDKIKKPNLSQILDEAIYPLDKNIVYSIPNSIPSVSQIEKFLLPLFLSSQLSAEAAIIFFIYLERTIFHCNITFSSSNWARWLLGTAIMTSKVWEDQAVWNVDFCQLFPNLDVNDL
eukprot:NODE_146_length_17563_cov_0.253321.p6 type:complete len:277 gc:universal NODE_146_length_17563_cov_0.253321:16360-15530(-)